jgi:hypothetical protein
MDDAAEPVVDAAGPALPDPAERRRMPNPQGVPVVLGGGRTWVLAHGALAHALLAQADAIFDSLMLTRSISLGPATVVAWKLLVANYHLTDEEAQILLAGASDEDLADAAADALFGVQPPRRTWSTWALSALYANGIDPAAVPPFLVHEVLHQLVQTGRAMGQSDYIDSAAAAQQRAALYAKIPGLAAAIAGVGKPAPPEGGG